MVKDLCVGDQVLFSGYYTSKGKDKQFHLETILKHSFAQCSECHLPLTSNKCFIKHDKEAQKLDGGWRVVHKIERGGDIKVFFEKGHFVFAAVATPKLWYHDLFKKLCDNDKVSIEGWRYKQQTSIKTIFKIHENNGQQESEYEIME